MRRSTWSSKGFVFGDAMCAKDVCTVDCDCDPLFYVCQNGHVALSQASVSFTWSINESLLGIKQNVVGTKVRIYSLEV